MTRPAPARNAPRAEGLPPYPEDQNAAINRAALFGGLTGTAGYTTAYADYDPSSGRAISAEGKQFTLASGMGLAGYTVSGRNPLSADSSVGNVGFRVAASIFERSAG